MAGQKKKEPKSKAPGVPSAGARSVPLDEFLDAIRKLHEVTPEAERGACYVRYPGTGEMRCILTSPDGCKAVNGTYFGGPCGGMRGAG